MNEKSQQKNAETDSIRVLKVRMAERGLRPRDLAEMTDTSPRVISNLLTGNNNSWLLRSAINTALKEQIFSPVRLSKKTARAIRRAKNNIPTPHAQAH